MIIMEKEQEAPNAEQIADNLEDLIRLGVDLLDASELVQEKFGKDCPLGDALMILISRCKERSVSGCCGAPLEGGCSSPVCSDCKEHCDIEFEEGEE